MQADGNDVFAVYKAVQEAIIRAREKKEPTLIELVTYRLGNHTTSDDYKHYRSEEEVNEWRKKDPIDRLRKFMQRKGMWSDYDEQAANEHAKKIISEAVEEYEQLTPQNPEDLFDYLYEELPPVIRKQKEEFLSEIRGAK